jgi:hypothetical protein
MLFFTAKLLRILLPQWCADLCPSSEFLFRIIDVGNNLYILLTSIKRRCLNHLKGSCKL